MSIPFLLILWNSKKYYYYECHAKMLVNLECRKGLTMLLLGL